MTIKLLAVNKRDPMRGYRKLSGRRRNSSQTRRPLATDVYRRSNELRSKSVIPLTTLMLVAACVNSVPPSGTNARSPDPTHPSPSAAIATPEQRGVQTIIKMKDLTVDPRRPEILALLSKAAQAAVTYVRPMSGHAHVIAVLPTPPTSYDNALQGIRESGLVEYVELDATLKALPQR